jgi:plasmid maintenance system antidote protein VapI
MTDYQPSTPGRTLRPGILLLEALRERDMTPLQAALRGGLAPRTVTEILRGRKRINPVSAAAIGAVLGNPAAYWMNAQAQYDADLARGAEDVSGEHEHE